MRGKRHSNLKSEAPPSDPPSEERNDLSGNSFLVNFFAGEGIFADSEPEIGVLLWGDTRGERKKATKCPKNRPEPVRPRPVLELEAHDVTVCYMDNSIWPINIIL